MKQQDHKESCLRELVAANMHSVHIAGHAKQRPSGKETPIEELGPRKGQTCSLIGMQVYVGGSCLSERAELERVRSPRPGALVRRRWSWHGSRECLCLTAGMSPYACIPDRAENGR